MATPTVAAIRRCGSRVAASDITTNVTWPGSSRLLPCARERIRHLGGKMLDTRTRLQAAMPAERRASSNEVSFSRCLPTPFVKNISLGTNPATSTLLVAGENRILNSTLPGVKTTQTKNAAAAVNFETSCRVLYLSTNSCEGLVTDTIVRHSPVPAPRSLLARMAGVVFSPRATYAGIVERPRVAGALIVVTAIAC